VVGTIRDATRKALIVALNGALLTLDKRIQVPAQNVWHKLLLPYQERVEGLWGCRSNRGVASFDHPHAAIHCRHRAERRRTTAFAASKLACMEVFAWAEELKG